MTGSYRVSSELRMMASEAALRRFIVDLQQGRAPAAPSPALAELAARASKLDPRSLDREAKALLARDEDPAATAAVALGTLRGLLGDIEEHGEHAEYVDDKAFIVKAVAAWSKHANADAAENVMLADNLEESLVAVVEYAKLPAAEAKAWAALRKASKLTKAVATLVKQPVAPWFAELVAAHIARELDHIGRSKRAESWMAKLDDAPALLGQLGQLGMPPRFGARAVAYARRAAERHDHAPTRQALETLTAPAKPRAKRAAKPATAKRTKSKR